MKITRYILASVILSLVLHLLLLMCFARMRFRSPLASAETHKERDLISIHLLSPLSPQQETAQTETQTPDAASRKSDEALREELQAEGTLAEKKLQEVLERENITVQLPAPKIQFAGLEGSTVQTDLPKQMAPEPAQAPRPKIIQIEAPELPPASREERVVIPQVERIDVPDVHLPSLLPHGKEISGTGGSFNVGMRLTPPSFQPPDVIPEDKPFGEGGALPPMELPPVDLQPDDAGISTQQPLPFDQFVNVNVVVQEDRTRGGGYFMVTIQANERSENVAEIALDTLFIIDHSTSISSAKLQEFKDATINALEYLNPRDRFNIVTFNNEAKSLATSFAPATRKNLDVARTFISRIVREGTTDVFGGIHPFVKASNGTPGRPLNIYLLTDGISTVNIYKKEDFLQKIVGINPGNVSIHTFSAGKEANRELLDYLAMLNHGYSEHAPAVKDIHSQLTRFIASLGHLLISDMSYIAPASLAREIYPKQLPHLYRNAPLRLFGKYSPADKELVLTIRGRDAEGKQRDLVFSCAFTDCEKTQEELGRLWAARKIFQLLTDKVLATDPAVKQNYDAEIKRLKTSFSIAVPYN